VEWPISISLAGRYHNLAILFNRLSNFSRIINVEQITITALSIQTERTIAADFVAKTFMYVEPKAPEKAPAGKASSSGGGTGE
jgi:type IV pilus assembly protein PilO